MKNTPLGLEILPTVNHEKVSQYGVGDMVSFQGECHPFNFLGLWVVIEHKVINLRGRGRVGDVCRLGDNFYERRLRLLRQYR